MKEKIVDITRTDQPDISIIFLFTFFSQCITLIINNKGDNMKELNSSYKFELETGSSVIPVTSTDCKEVTQSIYNRAYNTIISNIKVFQETLCVDSGFDSDGDIITFGELPYDMSYQIYQSFEGSIFVDSKIGSNTYCKIDDKYYLCLWVFRNLIKEGKLLMINIDNINDVIRTKISNQ